MSEITEEEASFSCLNGDGDCLIIDLENSDRSLCLNIWHGSSRAAGVELSLASEDRLLAFLQARKEHRLA